MAVVAEMFVRRKLKTRYVFAHARSFLLKSLVQRGRTAHSQNQNAIRNL